MPAYLISKKKISKKLKNLCDKKRSDLSFMVKTVQSALVLQGGERMSMKGQAICPQHEGQKIICEIYSVYHSAMLKMAVSYVRNLWDAEDIVSDCCVSLMRHTALLERLAPAQRTKYVMTAVRNSALSHLRRKNRAPLLCTDELLDAYAGSVEPLEAEMAYVAAEQLLAYLSGREGEVAQLRLQMMPTREIAMRLDLAESTVRVCWHRARRKMQKMLRSSDAG